MENNLFLEICGVSKIFPGIRALDKVSFDIREGEVHAICGENGAGKSTLINVLAGNYRPDEGYLKIKGDRVAFANQSEAIEAGIAVVYQERSLVGNLSVEENIFADKEPLNRFGFIDGKELSRRTKEACQKIKLDLNPKMLIQDVSPADQQMVEIAKAMTTDCKLIVFDEPTAALTDRETKVLFELIREFKSKKISVIYISHRLEEIFEISDRVTVLKDGKYVGTKNTVDTNMDQLIQMMIGRDLVIDAYKPYYTDKVALKVENLCGARFENISFEAYEGEILGFSGLAGAGRTETFRAIVGADRLYSGEITVYGKKVKIHNTTEAIQYGIGYLPEDRKEEGLFLEQSIASNIISGNMDAAEKNGFLSDKMELEVAEKYRKILNIATPDVKKMVGELSGGNQQKVVFAKWLLVNPKVLIVDEPTKGVDVGSKSEIYRIMRKLAKEGTCVIAISSDLPEILQISDRVIVMHAGHISGECKRSEMNEEAIMRYSSGLA